VKCWFGAGTTGRWKWNFPTAVCPGVTRPDPGERDVTPARTAGSASAHRSKPGVAQIMVPLFHHEWGEERERDTAQRSSYLAGSPEAPMQLRP